VHCINLVFSTSLEFSKRSTILSLVELALPVCDEVTLDNEELIKMFVIKRATILVACKCPTYMLVGCYSGSYRSYFPAIQDVIAPRFDFR